MSKFVSDTYIETFREFIQEYITQDWFIENLDEIEELIPIFESYGYYEYLRSSKTKTSFTFDQQREFYLQLNFTDIIILKYMEDFFAGEGPIDIVTDHIILSFGKSMFDSALSHTIESTEISYRLPSQSITTEPVYYQYKHFLFNPLEKFDDSNNIGNQLLSIEYKI